MRWKKLKERSCFRVYLVLILPVLFLLNWLGNPTAAFAGPDPSSPMTTLETHVAESSVVATETGRVATASTQTPTPNDRLISIIDRLTRILDRLVKMIENLLKPPKRESPKPKTPASKPDPKPESKPVPAGAKGGKALLGWLQQAGFKGEALRTAWAIGMRESGGNPRAFNGNANTGDKSYGLFQINMIGKLGPARLKSLGLSKNEDLFDPMISCKAMFKLSNGGKDFGPWGLGPNAYRNSAQLNAAWKKFYDQFPPK